MALLILSVSRTSEKAESTVAEGEPASLFPFWWLRMGEAVLLRRPALWLGEVLRGEVLRGEVLRGEVLRGEILRGGILRKRIVGSRSDV